MTTVESPFYEVSFEISKVVYKLLFFNEFFITVFFEEHCDFVKWRLGFNSVRRKKYRLLGISKEGISNHVYDSLF